jgi:hypothetical protein
MSSDRLLLSSSLRVFRSRVYDWHEACLARARRGTATGLSVMHLTSMYPSGLLMGGAGSVRTTPAGRCVHHQSEMGGCKATRSCHDLHTAHHYRQPGVMLSWVYCNPYEAVYNIKCIATLLSCVY